MTDRKVVLKMVMSLDGFVTSPDGTHEWMFEWFGDDSGEWNRRALDAAGVHAMGRRSRRLQRRSTREADSYRRGELTAHQQPLDPPRGRGTGARRSLRGQRGPAWFRSRRRSIPEVADSG